MINAVWLLFSALGFLWGNGIYGHIFVPVIVLAWLSAPNRTCAWLLMLLYYLAAARGVPFGYRIYETLNPGEVSGYLLWFAACAALSLPWALLWKHHSQRKFAESFIRLLCVMLLISVPPIGIVGWTNPIMYGAAWYFPGTGFIGILLTMVVLVCVQTLFLSKKYEWSLRWQKNMVSMLALFVLLSMILNVKTEAVKQSSMSAVASEWQGVDTNIGGIEGKEGFEALNACLDYVIYKATTGKHAFVLMPEFASFRWDDLTNMTLSVMEKELAAQGVTVIINAQGKGENSGSYDNEMRAFGKNSGYVYRQRFPPPVGMWRPWTKGWTRAHWLDSGIWQYMDRNGHNKKAACLICYEQLLVMPVVVSMLFKPDIIIAQENHWWSRYTSIPNCSREAVTLVGRLFGVPVVTARNV